MTKLMHDTTQGHDWVKGHEAENFTVEVFYGMVCSKSIVNSPTLPSS